jgi:hypothetical protein
MKAISAALHAPELAPRGGSCSRPKFARSHDVSPGASRRPVLRFRVPIRSSARVCASASNPNASAAMGAISASESAQLGTALRNIGWISFWAQLILSTVSGVVLLFSTGVTSGGAFAPSPTDVCTLVGVASGLLATFLSWTWVRAGKALQEGKMVKLQQCMGTVLVSTRLNLIGLGATVVGLQAAVGALVAKTLSSAAGGMAYYNPRAAPPPVAFDVFTVQSCTNTIMAHFVGLVLANWLLGIVRSALAKEEA